MTKDDINEKELEALVSDKRAKRALLDTMDSVPFRDQIAIYGIYYGVLERERLKRRYERIRLLVN